MLGVGESRSPVFSPGSMEPRREAGPAAMGHPPWGSSMGFTLSTSEMGSIGPCPLDRPSTARRGGGPERSPVRSEPSIRISSHRVGFCWGDVAVTDRRYRERIFAYLVHAGKRLSEGRYPNV